MADFGKKDDNALVAVQDETVVGAVWSRIMKDYGHVDDQIPSLAIALFKEYRGQGIGTALMRQMLLLLREKGYEKVSLSVQKANYAVKMYKAVGFRVLEDREEEYYHGLRSGLSLEEIRKGWYGAFAELKRR